MNQAGEPDRMPPTDATVLPPVPRRRPARRSTLGALLWSACSLLAVGCATSDPFPGFSADQLWEAGLEAYESEEWEDAILAFQRLTSQNPGHPQGPEARIYLARAHEAREEYLSAAAEYERFLQMHFNHGLAPEASLGMCQAYAAIAPNSQRDQSPTRTARDACARTVVEFRGLTVAQEAEEIRLGMVDLLAKRAFEEAQFYQRRGVHVSAVQYFEEGVVLAYPNTDWAPRALLEMYRSYRELEWDEEAEETASRLLLNYPDSSWAGELRAERDGAADGGSGE